MLMVMGMLLGGCGKVEESQELRLEEMGYEVSTEDFHRAAEIGDVGVMERMLEAGMDLEARSLGGDQGLHAAAAAGSEAGVKFFVEQGMSVDARGAGERTALMVAAEQDEWEVVRELLKLGAKTELVDAGGYRAVTLAADVGSAEAIEALSASSRPFLDDALLLASLRGHSKCVALLADYGGSVYARMDDGMTPLMLAAREGHVETVEVLLERGANRYALDVEDRTAGQIAMEGGHGSLAARLNADPGAEAFSLPELPELVAGDDAVAGGALLGGGARAIIGHQEGSALEGALIGAALGGQAGYVVGGEVEEEEGVIVGSDEEVVGEERELKRVGERLESGATVDGGDEAEAGGAAVAVDGGGPPEVVRESGRERSVSTVDGGDEAEVRGAVVAVDGGEEARRENGGEAGASAVALRASDEKAARTGLVMARYEEKPLPLRIEGAEEGEVRVRYLYGENERVTVKEGEVIPLTGLRVVEVRRKLDHSKMNGGQPTDVSVVVVEDPATGRQRELTVQLEAEAHEPFAVMRTGKAGEPRLVRRGAVLRGADGRTYRVIDVRPTQVVVEGIDSGEVLTLNLTKN